MPDRPGMTVTADHPSLGEELVAATSVLVRAFTCERPLEPPARHELGDVEVVTIGRGQRARVVPADGRLTLEVPDERMSAVHAVVRRAGGGFSVEDAGSKNGTLLNGEPCQRGQLRDGDVLEVGHTFFVFRAHARRMGPEAAGDGELQTCHPGLARQLEILGQIADSPLPVVLLGETGTGKEVLARALHEKSRRAGAFAAVNCGAIAPNLIESELFGAKKGAYSGSVEDRPGLVRSADGGTLFLDEIGEIPPAAQVALLRVLQEQEVLPVGGSRPIKVDVRVIAATHRDLDKLVDEGAFRADLYARLAGYSVRLPPLRERREDLGLICANLLRRLAPEPEKVALSRAAARALFLHAFPLNVRELEKALLFALARARPAALVRVEHLPEAIQRARWTAPDDAAGEDEARKAQLIELLGVHRGRVARVAEAMGKHRTQIHRWLERYGLDPDAYRKR